MTNKTANQKLQSKLAKLCKGCELKKALNRCPYSDKLECTECNLLIATTVLTQYSTTELMQVPASAYINGLLAHKYVGEPIHYSCVDYIKLPIDFFISGLKAHGYSGELRKTKIVTI